MKYGLLRGREGFFLESSEGWAELAPFPGLSRESLEDVVASLKQSSFSPCVSLAQAMCARELPIPHVARVPLNALLTDQLAAPWEEALLYQRVGYRSFKLKVGLRPWREDAQRVLRLREALGAEAEIRLDANRTWRLSQAVAFAEAVATSHLAYIEEPLVDAGELGLFCAQTGMGVALDESLMWAMPQAFPGLKALVLKPTLLGWERTWLLGQWAASQGLKTILSSTFETGLTLSFFARLAAFWSPTEAAGLDTWRAFVTEVCPWYQVEGGEMWTTPEMRTQPDLNPLYFQKWQV